MKNEFKAPIRKLQSSWVTLAFSKPKSTGVIVKRSLSSRAKPIFKSRGVVTTISLDHSY